MADNTAVYEGLFILDSNKFAREREGLAREVEALVEAIDGEVLVSRLWEERRLAFPIKGQRKGHEVFWEDLIGLEGDTPAATRRAALPLREFRTGMPR